MLDVNTTCLGILTTPWPFHCSPSVRTGSIESNGTTCRVDPDTVLYESTRGAALYVLYDTPGRLDDAPAHPLPLSGSHLPERHASVSGINPTRSQRVERIAGLTPALGLMIAHVERSLRVAITRSSVSTTLQLNHSLPCLPELSPGVPFTPGAMPGMLSSVNFTQFFFLGTTQDTRGHPGCPFNLFRPA